MRALLLFFEDFFLWGLLGSWDLGFRHAYTLPLASDLQGDTALPAL
jgi:hypothetical protein